MKPVNSKSLLAFVFDQMEKLDKGETKVEEAQAQAKLAQQANNIVKNEHERTRVLMELARHNAVYKDGLNLREIESKNFD